MSLRKKSLFFTKVISQIDYFKKLTFFNPKYVVHKQFEIPKQKSKI